MFEGLGDELKRPATAIAAGLAVLGIIFGLTFSLIFYKKSIRAGQLSYRVEQVQIFQADFAESSAQKRTKSISVIGPDGQKIDENILQQI